MHDLVAKLLYNSIPICYYKTKRKLMESLKKKNEFTLLFLLVKKAKIHLGYF